MTALEKYVRLEAIGLWREGPGSRQREVVVSFGEPRWLLKDLAERPLGHWALAGIAAIGRDGGATVYSMTLDGDETLTIRDREMVAAIAAVARGYRLRPAAAPPPAPLPLAAVVVASRRSAPSPLGPDLVRDQAARMVPPEQAREFGDRMLLRLIEAARGGPCAEPARQPRARRASPIAAPAAAVARARPRRAAPAVGAARRDPADRPARARRRRRPRALAGWLEAALGPAAAPVHALMRAAGPFGQPPLCASPASFGETALARAADAALTPSAAAGFTPAAASVAPSLSDQDWVAIQGICG